MTDFRSAKKVHEHLESQGYDVALRTVQLHVKQGKLVRGEGRRFSVEAVRQYAGSYLTAPALIAQTGEAGSKEEYQRERARREKWVADQEEMKAKKLRGSLIERADVDRRIGQAAAIFKSSASQFFIERAPDIVHMVGGDSSRVPVLIEYLQDSVMEWCRVFAKDRDLEVEDATEDVAA